MIEKYCDIDNERIINYASKFSQNYSGIYLINRIYIDIKNFIYYDPYIYKEEKASETLVMGRGDNKRKNILLYTVFKSLNFNCELKTVRVKDLSNKIIARQNEVLDWFYVFLDFMGKKINLEPTFDTNYMRSIRFTDKNIFGEFNAEKYYVEEKRLFKKIDDIEITYPINKNLEDNTKSEAL
ncbi:hypothetical protein [Clostridium amazonitimonense]|uniref:hypothetical protein n=1 Tax=Clostridium amazonitimonense TaxID=1499689 RepID=UPI0005095645|nr:hypothetical protein [Clostridium amazonitimonense]